MRLLIAAGGTGGHIYPALAVARSLRDEPDAPELGWLGGHRGLEADARPRPPGSPLRRLALRSLRTVDLSRPRRPRPDPAGASRCRRRRRSSPRWRPGGDLHDRRLRRDPGAAWPRRALRIPVVLWEGNVVPGRSVRATARLADAIAVSLRGDRARARRAGTPCYVTGTPIRDAGRDRPRGGARAARTCRRTRGCCWSSAARRPCAGSTPPSARRCRGSSSGSTSCTSPATTATPAALAGRERLPAELRDRYRPYPFLRDEMLPALAAADLVVGRAGSSTLAEVTALGLPIGRRPVSARRGPPARERAGPRRGRRRATRRRRGVRRRRAASRRPSCSTTGRARARWPPRPGRSAGRAPRDAVAELVLAAGRAAAAARRRRRSSGISRAAAST